MKNFKNKLKSFGLTAVLLGLLILNADRDTLGQGNEPAGPTKPVVVVNTPANPVPVTGTITGNVTITNTPTVGAQQSGLWNVGILGTPTVKIDPNNNSVVVAPKSTQLLLNTGFYDVSAGGYPALGPFNVGQFSKIRVAALNLSTSDGSFNIIASAVLPGGTILSLDGANFVTLQPGQTFTRVYEVPGQTIQINVQGNGPNRNGAIAVFGN